MKYSTDMPLEFAYLGAYFDWDVSIMNCSYHFILWLIISNGLCNCVIFYQCSLVWISTNKFSRDNKIFAQAWRASAIFWYLKNLQVLGRPNCKKNSCYYLLIMYRQNFESVFALFIIFSHVTTLNLCYMRSNLFSANQKHVILSCTLLYI